MTILELALEATIRASDRAPDETEDRSYGTWPGHTSVPRNHPTEQKQECNQCCADEAPGLAGVRLADARLSRSWLYTLRRARASRVRSPKSWALHWTTGAFGPVIQTDATKVTSIPGVYAAGDINRSMHNATPASVDGVIAGGSLHQALVFEPNGK